MKTHRTRFTVLTLGALLCAGPAAAQGALSAGPASAEAAPAPWLTQDPGDSLYRAGRTALNRGDYRTAAGHFSALRDRYPRSGYVGDAYYWEAFALSKLGTKDDLRGAVALLERQAGRYPEARTARDARELRVRVQGELARLGDEAAAAAVAEAAAPLAGGVPLAPAVAAAPAPAGGVRYSQRDRCSDEDDERLIALNALMNMRAEQAVPILRQVLQKRDATSVCLRRQAVFLLSQKRSPEVASLLLAAVRSDPDAEVRENAVFWLSQVNSPEAIAALDSILQHGADRSLQEKAVFALSQQRSEAAGRALRAHLERSGTPDDIKEHIIFWLGQRRSPENAQYLRDYYGKASSQSLKEKVIFSLSQMGLEDNGRWLLSIAQDEREALELRKNAIFWVGQMKSVSLDEVAALYGRSGQREIKEQLIFALSQRHEAAAVDQLMQIARTESDRELRGKAIFWLGQSRDPRVAEFLVEMINR